MKNVKPENVTAWRPMNPLRDSGATAVNVKISGRSRTGRAVFLFFLIFLSPLSLSASNERFAPRSWVYPALRTFELAGLVRLDPDLPWSRREVEFYLDRILHRIANEHIELTAGQRFLLDRLREEFQGKSFRPREREDRPFWAVREGRRFCAVDVTGGGYFRRRKEREKGEMDGLLIPSLLFDLGRGVTGETCYRIRMEPERESNRGGEKPSPRLRSFRGVSAEYERAYLFFYGKRWNVLAGRDYLHWGSAREEGLLLSRTAGSLDQVSAALSIGRFKLSLIHAVLDPVIPRRLAGHRLSIRLPRGFQLGISETVVYTGRGLDFAYLLPVGAYYANQYNEKEDDNILWSLDCKIPLRRGLILYGELLIDDFQYEREPPAPDRLGFNITGEAQIEIRGSAVEFAASYTYIDIFTYAHKDTLRTRYVAGDGLIEGNPLLGSALGPDADRWDLRVSVPLRSRTVIDLIARITRTGEGNDLHEWKRDSRGVALEDPDPRFPSGEVMTERILALEGRYDLGRGSSVEAGGGFASWDQSGLQSDRWFVYLGLLLDY
ncbi:MAG: hypothetical protein JXB45_06735 [Candidatus Krumholzibacteriota bacterium]|nr:hypothetical protein [Candidatus Krumholzibacteriota bacterium]